MHLQFSGLVGGGLNQPIWKKYAIISQVGSNLPKKSGWTEQIFEVSPPIEDFFSGEFFLFAKQSSLSKNWDGRPMPIGKLLLAKFRPNVICFVVYIVIV